MEVFMTKSIAAVAALSFLLLQSPAARADDVPPPIAAVATILQLTPDQIGALVMMIQSREANVRPLLQEMQARQPALAALIESANPDAAAIGQALIDVHTLQQKVASTAKQSAKAFEQVLTSDQRQRLAHIREAAPICNVIPAFQGVGLL
jgi:Spy/CpxP family protein refolding chaperone